MDIFNRLSLVAFMEPVGPKSMEMRELHLYCN